MLHRFMLNPSKAALANGAWPTADAFAAHDQLKSRLVLSLAVLFAVLLLLAIVLGSSGGGRGAVSSDNDLFFTARPVDVVQGQLRLSGTATSGSVIRILRNGEEAGQVAAENGLWTHTIADPGYGRHRLEAQQFVANKEIKRLLLDELNRQVKVAGMEGDDITIIASPPYPRPDGTVSMTGRTGPKALVEGYIDEQKVGQTQADEEGLWRIIASARGIGEHKTRAQVVSIDGTPLGPSSDVMGYKIDPSLLLSTIAILGNTVTLAGAASVGVEIVVWVDNRQQAKFVTEDEQWQAVLDDVADGPHDMAIELAIDGVTDFERTVNQRFIVSGLKWREENERLLVSTAAVGGEAVLLVDNVEVTRKSVKRGKNPSKPNVTFTLPKPAVGKHQITILLVTPSNVRLVRHRNYWSYPDKPTVKIQRQAKQYQVSGTGYPGAQLEIRDRENVLAVLTVPEDGQWQTSIAAPEKALALQAVLQVQGLPEAQATPFTLKP